MSWISRFDQQVVNVLFFFRCTFGLIVCLLTVNSAIAQTDGFSKLVVFGDSLSDTGNLAVVDLPPPYFQNRISDGPVVADLIAQAIGSDAEAAGHLLGRLGGFNYAVAGGNITGNDPEDLTQQVTAYLQRVNNQADPDALYLVFSGGNDLRDIRSLRSAADASVEISITAETLMAQLNRLKTAGARAFMIPNVANIGRIPETIERVQEDQDVVVRAAAYTLEYNQLLNGLIDEFGDGIEVSVASFDLFSSLETLIENADALGFRNTQEGCFDADSFEIAPECLIFGFDSRIFFDSIHPSSASNQLVAAQMVEALPSLPSVSPVIPANPVAPLNIVPILQLLLD